MCLVLSPPIHSKRYMRRRRGHRLTARGCSSCRQEGIVVGYVLRLAAHSWDARFSGLRHVVRTGYWLGAGELYCDEKPHPCWLGQSGGGDTPRSSQYF